MHQSYCPLSQCRGRVVILFELYNHVDKQHMQGKHCSNTIRITGMRQLFLALLTYQKAVDNDKRFARTRKQRINVLVTVRLEISTTPISDENKCSNIVWSFAPMNYTTIGWCNDGGDIYACNLYAECKAAETTIPGDRRLVRYWFFNHVAIIMRRLLNLFL